VTDASASSNTAPHGDATRMFATLGDGYAAQAAALRPIQRRTLAASGAATNVQRQQRPGADAAAQSGEACTPADSPPDRPVTHGEQACRDRVDIELNQAKTQVISAYVMRRRDILETLRRELHAQPSSSVAGSILEVAVVAALAGATGGIGSLVAASPQSSDTRLA